MKLIDTADAPGRVFSGGTAPLGYLDSTILPAWFMQMVQTELINVLVGAGVAPDETGVNQAQILQAIRALIVQGYSSGSNAHGSWQITPDGFIEQWGEVVQPLDGSGSDTVAVTFPVPMPSGTPPTGVGVTTANTTATANGGSYSLKTAVGMSVALNAPLSFSWFVKGR